MISHGRALSSSFIAWLMWRVTGAGYQRPFGIKSCLRRAGSYGEPT